MHTNGFSNMVDFLENASEGDTYFDFNMDDRSETMYRMLTRDDKVKENGDVMRGGLVMTDSVFWVSGSKAYVLRAYSTEQHTDGRFIFPIRLKPHGDMHSSVVAWAGRYSERALHEHFEKFVFSKNLSKASA